MTLGSSPRVRGSRYRVLDSLRSGGIIPAGAGLTRDVRTRAGRGWDHPRGCGAHEQKRNDILSKQGSSPRVRGSPVITGVLLPPSGIIPAGAGLTRNNRRPIASERDHPRGCGAHILRRCRKMANPGSSPRVRGSLMFFDISRAVRGIIPAGAGLTQRVRDRPGSRRDHPRGCGAHTKKSQ